MENGPEEVLSKRLSLLQLDTVPFCAVASPQLTFAEFTLFAESKEVEKKPHVILHFSQPCFSSSATLETVDMSVISDKLPLEKHSLDYLFLIKFWANLNFTEEEYPDYYVTTKLQSGSKVNLEVKTKVCTFGQPIMEKTDSGWDAKFNTSNDECLHEKIRVPLCSYLSNFIRKLKAECPSNDMMNGVLENFTVIQVISNQDTEEILLSLGFVFEASPFEQSSTTTGHACSVFKLIEDLTPTP